MTERRDFLKELALITGGLMIANPNFSMVKRDKWGELLPMRTLGKTGKKVTMLGVGGYHVGWTSDRDAQEVIECAMEGGIRFFDNAESYGSGLSEERYGRYLVPKYRDEVFIMSKTTADKSSTAKKHLEETLRRLQCDYLDLWQVHSLRTPEDVDNRIQNEVLEVFEKAKAEGKVKHIGFTGHQNPYAHLRMLEKTSDHDLFETIQMPVNVIDSHFHSFIKNVFATAVDRKFGIIAMKTLSDGRFFKEKKVNEKVQWKSDDPLIPNYISIQEALHFVWSLPVSVLVTGAENKLLLQEKIELAQSFTRNSEADRLNLLGRVFAKAGNKIEYYKRI